MYKTLLNRAQERWVFCGISPPTEAFQKVPGCKRLLDFCSFSTLTDSSTSFYLHKIYFGELENSARARLLGTGRRSQICIINTNIFLS